MSPDQNRALSLADRLLKQQRILAHPITPNYLNTRFVVATSRVYEPLFNVSGSTIRDLRKGILPSNVEAQLSLNIKFNLMGIEDIHKIVCNAERFQERS